MKKIVPVVNANNIPQDLKNLPLWLVWFAKAKKNKSGYDKLPTITGKSILKGWTDKKYRLSFDDAHDLYLKLKLHGRGGVGIFIAPEANFTALDFDHCKRHTEQIEDTYTEFSPSGNGIRQFVFGRASGDCSNQDTNVEIYSGHSARFVTVTGNRIGKCKIIRKAGVQVNKLYKKHRNKDSHSIVNGDIRPCPDLKDLPIVEIDNLGLNAQIKSSILTGDASYYGDAHADRSAMLFGLTSSLKNVGLSREQTLSVLINNPCNQKAMEQSKNRMSAARWLWKYCVIKMFGNDDSEPVMKFAPEKSKIVRVGKSTSAIPVQFAEDVRKYIDGRMLRDQPMFATLAALTYLSALYGRYYRGEIKKTKLNIMGFLVGPPGASKTEVLDAVANLCNCVSESPIPVIERVGSAEGLEDAMFNNKKLIWLWEEAGKSLGRSVGRNASSHLSAIPDLLTTLYSSAGKMYHRRVTSNRKGEQEMSAFNLYLTMLGVMTTSEQKNMLNSVLIGGGFASRMLVATSPSPIPPMRPDYPGSEKVSESLHKTIFSHSHRSKVEGGSGSPKDQILVHESKTVTKLFDRYRIYHEKEGSSNANENEMHLRARAEENARRVACILAIAANGKRPIVTEIMTRWSIRFTGDMIETLIDEAEFTVTDESPYAIQKGKVLRIISRASKYASKHPKFKEQLESGMIPRRILIQNANMSSRDLDGTVNTLLESHEIGFEKIDDIGYYWLGDTES